MDRNKIPDNPKQALKVVCLFLAQSGPTHEDLGFATASKAFDFIGELFKVAPATVKNERDAFDRFTDSDRAGWNKLELPPRLKSVHDIYGNIPRDELRTLASNILEFDWKNFMTEQLPDLAKIISECRDKISKTDESLAVTLDPSDVDQLMASYRDLNKGHQIRFVGGHTFVVETGEQSRCISVQELPVLTILADQLRAFEQYRKSMDEISNAMDFDSRTSGDGSGFFKLLPNTEWKVEAGNEAADNFLEAIAEVLPNAQDRVRMERFISDPEWSGMADADGNIGRKLNRSTDWQESAILKTGGLVAAASAGRINFIRAIEHAGFGSDLVSVQGAALTGTGGENIIFYGAPGTGKSHHVNNVVKPCKHVRTVFHPDLQNSDFFGCLKPEMDGKDVAYRFSPGPFMLALELASRNPSEPVYLVIEELNRAAAAAVFGELFLLLDRDESGAGEYDVDFPSKESREWFCEKTSSQINKIKIPANLHIYATMNSADQGVYPLDTAFRRRWKQEYMKLDYDKGPDGDVGYHDSDGNLHVVPFRKFVGALNGYLLGFEELGIAEDRLLGQWFVKANELDGASVPEKILLYLWDDLLRHDGRETVFATGHIKTYGQLVLAIAENKPVFSGAFTERLNQIKQPDTTELTNTAEDNASA